MQSVIVLSLLCPCVIVVSLLCVKTQTLSVRSDYFSVGYESLHGENERFFEDGS